MDGGWHPQAADAAPAAPRAAPAPWRARAGDAALAAAPVLLLLAAWQVAAARGWLPEQILPAPALVLQTAREEIANGDLLADTLISLRRVAAGFALGAAAGLTLGGAIGLSRRARAYLEPGLLALGQVPALGWLPLLILLAGIGEAMKLTVIAWSAAVPILLGTSRGLREVPTAWRELGAALLFGRAAMLRRIILPAALPVVFTGLREGLANAWQTMVVAELFASYAGLGYLMGWGRQLFALDLVLVAVAVVAVIGLAMNHALAVIERRLRPWQAAVAAPPR
ncbi:MAG TPA: ABC transporter permease subunit [Acetobacteraceae bacterium]|nr:ABC transporter permease subunit [Acetobacteraceae bacterium]